MEFFCASENNNRKKTYIRIHTLGEYLLSSSQHYHAHIIIILYFNTQMLFYLSNVSKLYYARCSAFIIVVRVGGQERKANIWRIALVRKTTMMTILLLSLKSCFSRKRVVCLCARSCRFLDRLSFKSYLRIFFLE